MTDAELVRAAFLAGVRRAVSKTAALDLEKEAELHRRIIRRLRSLLGMKQPLYEEIGGVLHVRPGVVPGRAIREVGIKARPKAPVTVEEVPTFFGVTLGKLKPRVRRFE